MDFDLYAPLTAEAAPVSYRFRVSKVSSKIFNKGVSEAKAMGGKYDGVTQTWTITIGKRTPGNLLSNPGVYGLILCEGPAISRSHDSTCPALMGGACECR